MEKIRQPGSIPMTGTNSSKTKVVSAWERAPTQLNLDVRHYLNANLPQCWVARAVKVHLPLLRWPPRSPDLTPFDFFCGAM
jgi:hypothetical protein